MGDKGGKKDKLKSQKQKAMKEDKKGKKKETDMKSTRQRAGS